MRKFEVGDVVRVRRDKPVFMRGVSGGSTGIVVRRTVTNEVVRVRFFENPNHEAPCHVNWLEKVV